MKRRTLLVVALALSLAGSALAQTSNPPLYRPVLLGNTYSAATNNFAVGMQAKPTGGTSTVQTLVFAPHDFSHTRFGSGRWFLRTENDGNAPVDLLTAADESGTQTVVLSPQDGTTREFWRASWSLDGTRVAWAGGVYDLNDNTRNTFTEYGVYIGDVVLDAAGNPAGLANVRQVVSRPSSALRTNPQRVTWTGDQQYLIYSDYNGTSTRLFRVSTGAVAPGSEQAINIAGLPGTPFTPKACRVSGDGRIAFQISGSRGITAAYDIWTVNVPATYNPATDTLTARQITTKGTVKEAIDSYNYDWSPDGTQFVYTAYPQNLGYPVVGKVASSGGSGSTTLLSSNKAGYKVWIWRN